MRIRIALQGLMLLAMVGCAQARPEAPGAASQLNPGAAPAPPKMITVSALNTLAGFGAVNVMTTGGGARSLLELHTAGLVSQDTRGDYEARLAAKLPSFDDGSVVTLPDGRVQITWRLRSNVTWQDGAPFTADDLALGFQIMTDPELPLSTSANIPFMESVTASDPTTVVMTWKRPYYAALGMGFLELWPAPTHLLGQAYQGDKTAFQNLPYWTSEYVHLGAFKVADWGLGENIVLKRFDNFVMGPAKVGTIIIRIIHDPNTLLANLRAGEVDIATELALSPDLVLQIREDWIRAGGSVVQRPSNWSYLAFQFDPQVAKPVELSQSPQLRRGLYFGLDKRAIIDAILPNIPNTSADGFLPDEDSRTAIAGKPFAQFQYDPTRAVQELAGGGWTKSGSRIVNVVGQQAQLVLRTTAGNDKVAAISAQYWRDLGLEINEELVPGPLIANREYRSHYSAVEFTSKGDGTSTFRAWQSSQLPTPQNGYGGSNRGSYQNPTFDRLTEALYSSISEREQAETLKSIGQVLSEDLPMLPLLTTVAFAVVRPGVHALEDFSATREAPGSITRNAHLWDKE